MKLSGIVASVNKITYPSRSQQNDRRPVAFFNLGGTWDMVEKNGKLTGLGYLDDEHLYKIEESLGFYEKGQDVSPLELQLAQAVEEVIRQNSQASVDLVDYLSWVPNIARRVMGTFVSLYSGDSSHLRTALVAPLAAFILSQANASPSIQILGAQGTDTADIALLPLLDAYIFDTDLLPILLTGSNRSHREWHSDASKNFSDLVRCAGKNLPAGVYWVFADHVYRASDSVKIDPLESRRIENLSTFFAPRLTARHTKKAIAENHMFQPALGTAASKNHVSQRVTTENLYNIMTQIAIVDIGNLNNMAHDVNQILSKDYKATIVVAHSLGNASNPIRHACVQAALYGKLVVVVSRSLIGAVNQRYAVSLLATNEKELAATGKHIISGHRMNKNVAKAIVTRALQENFDQVQTQKLVNAYCHSRGLLVH